MIGVLTLSAPVRSRMRHDMMEVCCLSSLRGTTPVLKPRAIPPTARRSPKANRCHPISHAAMPAGHVSVHTICFRRTETSDGSFYQDDQHQACRGQIANIVYNIKRFIFLERIAITSHLRDVKYLLNLAKTSKKRKKSTKKHISKLDRQKTRKITICQPKSVISYDQLHLYNNKE